MTKTEQAAGVQKDVKKYSKLEAVANSEGGQDLIKGLKKDILSAIDTICSKYKTAPHIELLAPIASLSERLALLRTLTRAKKNKNLAIKELDEILAVDDLLPDEL